MDSLDKVKNYQSLKIVILNNLGIILSIPSQIDQADPNFFEIKFSPDQNETLYECIKSQWTSAYTELSSIIKFGISLSSNSFSALCRQWLALFIELQADSKGPKLNYNSLVQRAMLGACAELLGNVHGDWGHEDIYDQLTQPWPRSPPNGTNGTTTTKSNKRSNSSSNSSSTDGSKRQKGRVLRRNGANGSEVSSSSDIHNELEKKEIIDKLNEINNEEDLGELADNSISQLLSRSISMINNGQHNGEPEGERKSD